MKPLAHVADGGREHDLAEHLRGVAKRARRFAEDLGGGAHAELAGLWHDLGKYAADFQRMIRAAQGAEAHVETEADIASKNRVDHSTAGALHAARRDGQNGLPIAFVIAGHHAGLADLKKLHERLQDQDRGQRRLDAALAASPPAEILDRAVPPLPPLFKPASPKDGDAHRRLELFTRMIFSALCDADFLDTEAFFDSGRAELRAGHLPLEALAARLRAHVDGLARDDTEVNRVRAEVRRACLAAVERPPGVFTLNVPTGGGKTLAAMEFALGHALRHDLRRVVVAIPYTSIIEQNADVYRRAFGLVDRDSSLVEHHSAIDPKRESARNRIAAENWDAPVIVTTNVQLLESLFANRPGACRKLHNLARSVIVLDEAQTLPRDLLAPTTDVLEALVRHYGASLVLCTATQPALTREGLRDCGLTSAVEIVPDPHALAERLRRVEVDWTRARSAVTWDSLAEEIAGERDALAIVHRRDDARELCAAVDAKLGDRTTLHLSALMCPVHRSAILANVRTRKAAGEPVRVVSTQLVEAGVDLDFPVVYRALAGIDSLAQAAGRCNREGRLVAGRGALRVFLAPTAPPEGVLVQGLAITQTMIRASDIDLFAPGTHREYFERLYGVGNHDKKEIQAHREKLRFATVAGAYRVIDESWAAPLVIPFDDRARHAIRDLEHLGPSRGRLRELQRVTVNVARRDREQWVRTGDVREFAAQVIPAEGAPKPVDPGIDRPLGWMFYDWHRFPTGQGGDDDKGQPLFFEARLTSGILRVPERDEVIAKNGAAV
jgi:CRISPR-associated endonuclease/helicase Cas3